MDQVLHEAGDQTMSSTRAGRSPHRASARSAYRALQDKTQCSDVIIAEDLVPRAYDVMLHIKTTISTPRVLDVVVMMTTGTSTEMASSQLVHGCP